MNLYRFLALVAATLGLLYAGCEAGRRAPQTGNADPMKSTPRPEQARGDVLTVTVHDGQWRLQIRRDGRHTIGYGALPQTIPVAPDAFDFEQVYDGVAPYAQQRLDRLARQRDTTVTYWFDATLSGLDPGDAGNVFFLPAEANPYLRDLFRKAYLHRDTARTFFDYETILRVWERAPFLQDE